MPKRKPGEFSAAKAVKANARERVGHLVERAAAQRPQADPESFPKLRRYLNHWLGGGT